MARDPAEALAALRVYGPDLAELWLDHDLGRHPDGRRRDVMPVVAELLRAADAGAPYAIGRILIHSANPSGALAIRRALEVAGYAVERHLAPIWRHDYG